MKAASVCYKAIGPAGLFRFVFSVFSIVLVSACYAPADNSLAGSARLEVRLPDPPVSEGYDRAVAGSGGFLYVRAFGAPSGEVGRFWGPLAATGKPVVISDIEPGQYAGFFVLHSSRDIGADQFYTWETALNPNGGTPVGLRTLMAYSDAIFRDYAYPSNGLDSIFANPVMSRGSMAITGPVTVRPGVNSVALTLVPVTNTDTNVVLANNNNIYYSTTFNDTSPVFFRVEYPGGGPQWSTTFFLMETVDPEAPSYFYTSGGKMVAGVSFDSSDGTYRGTVPTSAFPLYAYVGSVSSPSYFAAYQGGLPAQIEPYDQMGAPIANGGTLSLPMVFLNQTPSSATVEVRNTGTTALFVTGMSISGANPQNFAVSPAAPFTVPPRGNRNIVVSLLPLGPQYQIKTAALSLYSSDGGDNPYVINLSGMVS